MIRITGTIIGLGIFLLAGCGPENEDRQEAVVPEKTSDDLLYFKENIRKNPDSLALYQALVDTLANRGLFAEAAAWCDSAMAADKTTTISWLLAKGDLYRMAKIYDSAIIAYRNYLSFFPEDEQILLNLANTYAEKGDSTCLELCNRIAAMYPSPETKAGTAFIAGLYHNVGGRFPEARRWFDSAITLRYTFTEAWMERGYSYYDEKKFTEAEKNFSQLTTINRGNAEAWYWLGKSAEAAGKTQEAYDFYLRAYSLDRNLSDAGKAIERLKKRS
jgi:tetratricopeptide (TPR) repeat protein